MKSRLFFWAFVMSLLIGFGLALAPKSATGAPGYSNAIGEAYYAAINSLATNSYVGARSFDLANYNNVRVRYYAGNQGHAGMTNYCKNQWSDDGSNWYDEPVLVAGAVSGGEAPYAVNSRVLQIGASNAANTQLYGERLNRLDRWFRVAMKASSAESTAVSFHRPFI